MRAYLFCWAALLLVGCGARTELLAGRPRHDASTRDASAEDAPAEDAPVEDAPIEDASVEDAPEEDSLPLIDGSRPDHPNNCPDGSPTLIYVVTEQNQLYSFYPPAARFRLIGRLRCNDPAGATPFSMGVDRQGLARVVFDDGLLYLVDTRTAACSSTPYQPGQHGITTFGMGYVSDNNDPGETLYIAADESQTGASSRLGIIDTTDYTLSLVGTLSPSSPFQNAELTGTGDGRLFAFYARGATGSFVGQVDKNTAALIAETPLPSVDQGNAWAFAFWGGDFWLFTAPNGRSEVTRFRPSDNSVQVVAHLQTAIVGAGVSTCAPE